jgi:pentatricopeptide repeat protein
MLQVSRCLNLLHGSSCRGVMSFSTFYETFESLKEAVHTNKKVTASRLTHLFRVARSKQDIVQATQVLHMYELKNVDPVQETAGEFIKACLKNEAGDVALRVFQQHYRIGLFVNPGSLNKLLHYFLKHRDYKSVVDLFNEMKAYQIPFNATTYDITVRYRKALSNFFICLPIE